MSSISKEQVEHIAKLARIKLAEKEKEKFSNELSSILDYIGKLNQVDTTNIQPISQVTGLENVVRDDEVKSQKLKMQNKILKNVPSKKGDYIKVPKILE